MHTKYFFSSLFLLLSTTPIWGQLDNKALLLHANEIVEAEGQLEIVSASEAIYSERKRVLILNKESRANAFAVFYDPDSKIMELDANIYDLSGTSIREVRKSEIRDVAAVDGVSIYTENRIKHIELNHSEYPYILQFSYRQQLKGLSYAVGKNWYFQDRNTSAVTRSTYEVIVPEDLAIQYRLNNLELEPTVETKGNKRHYRWTAEDIPAIRFEPYDIPIHRQVPILRISPNQFEVDKYTGSAASWQDYGLFLQNLWNGRDQIPTTLKAQVQTLTAGAEGTREKIMRLYEHLQQSKRYVSVQLGIGGWQPFTAAYVEEKGYGDCKALSNYMKAMLREIGVESYPVIIYGGNTTPYEVEDQFVEPNAFNHAILYVPEEDMWLECTSTINPPGYLGEFCNNRKVLLITPEGGQLARTPKLSTEENKAVEQLQVRLSSDGSANLTYLGRLTGIPHEDWRYYAYAYSQEDIEDEIRKLGKLPTLDLGAVKIENDPSLPQNVLSFTATAKRYASRAGKRLFVPLNLICPRTYVPDAVENRQYPVLMPYGYSQQATITFEIPQGFKTESLPKPQEIVTPYGKYEIEVTEEEGVVTLQRNYEMYDQEHPAEEYEAFREFLMDVAKYDGSKMVLVSE